MHTILREIPLDFETVLARLPQELRRRGFEILSIHNLAENLRESLGVAFNDYCIISICNLPLAYKALLREQSFGLFLPTNIVVYEKDGMTVVGTIRPLAFMPVIGNEQLNEGALILERKLQEVLEAISKRRFLRERRGSLAQRGLTRAVA